MADAKPMTHFVVRGAFGFGLGGVVMCIVELLASDSLVALLIAGVMSGATGGAFLPGGRGASPALASGIGFGVAFVIPGLLGISGAAIVGLPYRVFPNGVAYGAVSWAALLGSAGAIGALSLRSRLRMIAGGIAFAIGGAIAGATAFSLIMVVDSKVFLGLFYGLAYVIGGALLGAAVGWLDSRTEDEISRNTPRVAKYMIVGTCVGLGLGGPLSFLLAFFRMPDQHIYGPGGYVGRTVWLPVLFSVSGLVCGAISGFVKPRHRDR